MGMWGAHAWANSDADDWVDDLGARVQRMVRRALGSELLDHFGAFADQWRAAAEMLVRLPGIGYRPDPALVLVAYDRLMSLDMVHGPYVGCGDHPNDGWMGASKELVEEYRADVLRQMDAIRCEMGDAT